MKPRIVLVGNFDVPFTSESHYAWTFENKLGWAVTRRQENHTSVDQILSACNHADMLFWVHTHGWSFAGEQELTPCNLRIPSFSYHLDRYFGIRNREKEYLQHPSFHLNFFFSTDGNHEEEWKAAGVNHRWILPGVVEYACHQGIQRDASWDIPILFVGSENYHGEYPFRPYLIQALRQRYGSAFQIHENVRESKLNDLYARAKVCIGDHIFAGEPRYCSDRLFETTGRGGFLLYPETEGITENIPGLVTYKAQDTDDLFQKIDYYLNPLHETERLHRRLETMNWVREYGTYTHRLSRILEIVSRA